MIQEAIRHYKYGITHDIFKEPVTTYAKLAIDALEKQIPTTPSIEGDGYCPEGHLVYDTWICPNCEAYYEIDYDDYDYCPKCGQAIDKAVFY
jgi:rubredoxin